MTRKPRRPIAAALVLLLLGSGMVSGQTRFSDVTDVVVVEIPVQVIHDGEPVRGLTAEDFEVRDSRKKRQIVHFDEIDVSLDGEGAETSVEDIPISARRHFLLLFDLALSRPGTVLRAREAAKRLVHTSLHPTDLVSVALYSVNGAQILLGFTSDREQIEIAIDTLGMQGLLYGTPDPLGIVLTNAPDGAIPVPGGPDQPGGVDVEAELRDILSRMDAQVASAVDRNSILALSSALTALAQMIGSVDGRKHVVFFSEGFNSAIPLGLGVGEEGDRALSQTQNESAMSGRFWEVNSDTRFGNTHTLGSLDEMSKEFVRAGAAVHSVDIGGMRAGADVNDRPRSDDGLFLMADKTGGEYYRNYNDFGDAVQKLIDRTSVTYLLTIQPTDLDDDGRYRRLNVKLKGGPKKATIIHRPGYHAPKPFSEQSPIERRMGTAELLLGNLEGGPFELDVVTEHIQGRVQRITIHVEGPPLMKGNRGSKMPTEFFSYAIDEKGAIRDFFSHVVTFDLSQAREKLARDGYELQGRLELRPGVYKLRTLVRNSNTGSTGLDTTTLVVSEDDPSSS
jgi:VWFA-related protein